MTPITDIDELRSLQMAILDSVHEFCQKQNLRYFLSSGTLLGAVRHGGYIPWDDDLDIYMPRDDYEVFLKTFSEPTGNYRVVSQSSAHNYYYTFAKVVDSRTRMVEKEVEGFEIGVYIDVFPVDYVSDDEAERQRVFRRKKLLYKIRRCKIAHANPLRSRLAYWCYRLLPVSVAWTERQLRRLTVLPQPTQTVCNMTEAGPSIMGCFTASDIAEQVDIKFEGKTYKTMVGYRHYLECTYGDYMTLPPPEQRVTHHFEAYWR